MKRCTRGNKSVVRTQIQLFYAIEIPLLLRRVHPCSYVSGSEPRRAKLQGSIDMVKPVLAVHIFHLSARQIRLPGEAMAPTPSTQTSTNVLPFNGRCIRLTMTFTQPFGDIFPSSQVSGTKLAPNVGFNAVGRTENHLSIRRSSTMIANMVSLLTRYIIMTGSSTDDGYNIDELGTSGSSRSCECPTNHVPTLNPAKSPSVSSMPLASRQYTSNLTQQ